MFYLSLSILFVLILGQFSFLFAFLAFLPLLYTCHRGKYSPLWLFSSQGSLENKFVVFFPTPRSASTTFQPKVQKNQVRHETNLFLLLQVFRWVDLSSEQKVCYFLYLLLKWKFKEQNTITLPLLKFHNFFFMHLPHIRDLHQLPWDLRAFYSNDC